MGAIAEVRLQPCPVFRERLEQKMAVPFRPLTQQAVNWDKARLFTPGGLYAHRTAELALNFFDIGNSHSVQLFRARLESQGLIFDKNQVVGGSVTAAITTATRRKDERVATFVQYDKERVSQEGADFQVDAANYRRHVNYDGGHIIDHKFSAGNSHMTAANYFPQHFYYNQTLKEHLVRGCDSFIEIPIYTENPPTIGVKGSNESHPIPIGIIFIQIKNKKIQRIYYFPNHIDYKKLSRRIKAKKSATLTSYFRLKKKFLPLFLPALIERKGELQESMERDFMGVTQDLFKGLLLAESDSDDEVITKFSFSVLHEDHVDPSLCLATAHFNQIQGEDLGYAFDQFGKFLVDYSIRNALKSEVVSIYSRLEFINVVVAYIEAYHQVSDKAVAYMGTFSRAFKDALKELQTVSPSMEQYELLFFMNTYVTLSDRFCPAYAAEVGGELFEFGDEVFYLYQLGDLLKTFRQKFKIADLKWKDAQNIVDIVMEASSNMEFIIEAGYPEEELEEWFKQVISACAEECLKFHFEGPISWKYQTSFERETQIISDEGWIRAQLNKALVVNKL